MTQPMLFPHPKMLARATDPATSHEAAERIVRTGKVGRQAAQVLLLVRHSSGCTSGELAEMARLTGHGLDRYQVSRRLADLWNKGLVEKCEPRTCRVMGTRQLTWRTTDGVD